MPLEETIDGFNALLSGEGDEIPEAAFYMVGNIDEAYNMAKKLAAELAKD